MGLVFQLLIGRLREICEAVVANLGNKNKDFFSHLSLSLPFNNATRLLLCLAYSCLLFNLAVTLKNVCELLEFSLLYNANQLRDVCTEYICNNLGTMMEARSVKSQISPITVPVKTPRTL